MSTNINSNNLPDVSSLEKLANELFMALPGNFPNAESLQKKLNNLQGSDVTFGQAERFNIKNPQTSFQNPHTFIPQQAMPAGSGFGISPSILQHIDTIDVKSLHNFLPGESLHNGLTPSSIDQKNAVNVSNPQTSFAEPKHESSSIPTSLLGSGISPSVLQHAHVFDVKNLQNFIPGKSHHGGLTPSSIDQGNAVNASNPQTSFAEPNTESRSIPTSLSGSGISPSVLQHAHVIDVKNLQNFIPGESNHNDFASSSIDQGNAVNASNPQTSFAEPKHESSSFPTSVSERGISPFDLTHVQHIEKLSNVHDQAFGNDLARILPSINSLKLSPQLPLLTDSSFYFISEARPFGKNEKINQQHAHTSNKDVHTSREILNKPFDANLIKKDFPILQERVNGKPLIWLDNAATTQKPKQVIDRISYFYEHENSNIHRAAHELAARATDAYESARQKVQMFINAGSINEIIFVRGATEAINLIAKSWGEQNLQVGDEIIVSHLEHHANIVPWQQLAAKKGLKLRVIPVDDDGQIILEEYAKLLNPRTKLVSFTQVSNALGTVTPAKKIIELAHQAGAKVLVDGAQSISHMRVDVRNLNCDWFVFSGHKVFGPTGIGVVYGKEDLLNETNPWQGGGNMIVDVTFEKTTYHKAPGRFEAGTGNIADAVGLGAALDYVSRLGIDVINQYEHFLLVYATNLLKDIPGLRLIGTAEDKASVLSFVFDGYKTEEVGAVLNQEGIAVRSGHHCAQPILRRFGLESTVRPSLAFYNTCSDVDVLVETLYQLRSGHKRAVR